MSVEEGNQIVKWRKEIELGLAALAENAACDSLVLKNGAHYVLQGGGKRLRALLTVALHHDMAKGSIDTELPMVPALALEALHAASLVHDDLPALDNDDMRRGRPACHKAFGEASAILLGDLLVGVAFSSIHHYHIALDKQARLSAILSRAWRELCIGQQLDLDAAQDPSQRHRMFELKTGALFGAAAACGAICADAKDEVVQGLYKWGVALGVLFQKLDDVADGECAESELNGVREGCFALRSSLFEIVSERRKMSEEVFNLILQLS